MSDVPADRGRRDFYRSRDVLTFCLAIKISIVIAVAGISIYIEHLCGIDPTYAPLKEIAQNFRRVALGLSIVGFLPMLAWLPLIRCDEHGIAFRRWILWSRYTWQDLRTGDVRYCPECRCLTITMCGQRYRWSLVAVSDADRQAVLDELVSAGVSFAPPDEPTVARMKPWWSKTVYEFSEDGITTITAVGSTVAAWRDIRRACIQYRGHENRQPVECSFETPEGSVQLCFGYSSLSADSTCRCPIRKTVISMFRTHISSAALVESDYRNRVQRAASFDELAVLEEDYRAARREMYRVFACFGLVGGVILAASALLENHAYQVSSIAQCITAVVFSMGIASVIGLFVPYVIDCVKLEEFRARRGELEREDKTGDRTEVGELMGL